MRARALVLCDDCGEMWVKAKAVKALICADDLSLSYSFQCPRCKRRSSHPLTRYSAERLVEAGVTISSWRLPAELQEEKHGPPISEDEIAMFHEQLFGDHGV